MSELNVVLPVRVSEDRLDILERISYFALDSKIPDNVFFTVVDDGSSKQHAKLIEQKCADLNIKYLRVESEKEYFSAGRARNHAAQNIDSKLIMFQDVDLMPYDGFYEQALNECYIQELDRFADRFVMFGVVYLTEIATKEYLNTKKNFHKSLFLNYLGENNKEKIDKFSTGTSVIIWRRDHYLCTGGNDTEFEGWGFEDLEYTCRAIRRNRKFPLPNQFLLDYKNFMTIQEFKGWKSVYRLYGDITFNKGIVMFHSWHPVNPKSPYIKRKVDNKALFEKKLSDFSREKIEPASLPRLSKGKSLVFRSNPWTVNRWTSPNLGEVVVIDENRFSSSSLINFILQNNISRVIFHNPYASDKLIELYNVVRDRNIPYIVCERGALRGSVFLDTNGFNADSSSYNSEYWDKEISFNERENVVSYIKDEKNNSDSLEIQKEKISKNKLRKKIGISDGKKVLFVPLQRPTDTVIKYFSGPIRSYENFISLIRALAYALPEDWEIVVKKHPLEIESPEIQGVYYANHENVKSLIELSDTVLVINSGVGVESMIYGKPVLVAGRAFYNHKGLCLSVSSVEDVLKGLFFKPDDEKTLRFLSYLINDFYSFGVFKTRVVDWIDGSKMTATTAIDYYCVRFPNEEEMFLERSEDPYIKTSSILFDRYRDANGNIRFGATVSEIKTTKKLVKKDSTSEYKKDSTSEYKKDSTSEYKKDSISEYGKEKASISPLSRKLRKLKRDPGLFLRDTRYPLLRNIGRLIK